MTENKKEKDLNNRRKVSIITGAIAILVVLSVFLLKSNISENNRLVLLILFALGCGGLSAALLGFITIKIKGSPEISAGGGFAVFLLIFFVKPWFFSTDFETIVFLTDQNSIPVSSENIKLKLRYSGKWNKGEYIQESNAFRFKPIPSNYNNDSLDIQIESSNKWVFPNKKTIASIKVTNGDVMQNLIRDSISFIFKGNIVPAKSFIVFDEFPQLSTVADSTGNFKIILPESYIDDKVRVKFFKENYDTLENSYSIINFQRLTLFKKNKK